MRSHSDRLHNARARTATLYAHGRPVYARWLHVGVPEHRIPRLRSIWSACCARPPPHGQITQQMPCSLGEKNCCAMRERTAVMRASSMRHAPAIRTTSAASMWSTGMPREPGVCVGADTDGDVLNNYARSPDAVGAGTAVGASRCLRSAPSTLAQVVRHASWCARYVTCVVACSVCCKPERV